MEMHVSKPLVVEWHWKFHSQWQGTSDVAQPHQSHVIAIPKNVTKVEEAVHTDIYQNICAVSLHFDMSIGTVHTVVGCMGNHRMFVQQIPWILIDGHKQ
jgi:hypothetical protein